MQEYEIKRISNPVIHMDFSGISIFPLLTAAEVFHPALLPPNTKNGCLLSLTACKRSFEWGFLHSFRLQAVLSPLPQETSLTLNLHIAKESLYILILSIPAGYLQFIVGITSKHQKQWAVLENAAKIDTRSKARANPCKK